MPAASARKFGPFMAVLVAILASVGGYVTTVGMVHLWNLKADRTTVEQMAADLQDIKASQLRIETLVDSTNHRITQMKCGRAIVDGCR